MIYIGFENSQKSSIVNQYRQQNGIEHTVVIYSDRVPKAEYDNVEYVTYDESITYVVFYRLLQEVGNNTLIVIDECLRTQNRYELTYNCIRHFLAQTKHQIIFQRLPQIDGKDDFMILFDFDTQSRWKGRKFDINLILDNSRVVVNPIGISFRWINVCTSQSTKKQYVSRRQKRFDSIGARDPHTIPRNLYLIGGKDKLIYINSQNMPLFGALENKWYIARNKRLKADNIATYQDFDIGNVPYTVVDLPHRFIDFADFITATNQYCFDVLVADLKVDLWYKNRYLEWSNRVNETITSLSE